MRILKLGSWPANNIKPGQTAWLYSGDNSVVCCIAFVHLHVMCVSQNSSQWCSYWLYFIEFCAFYSSSIHDFFLQIVKTKNSLRRDVNRLREVNRDLENSVKELLESQTKSAERVQLDRYFFRNTTKHLHTINDKQNRLIDRLFMERDDLKQQKQNIIIIMKKQTGRIRQLEAQVFIDSLTLLTLILLESKKV